MSDGFTIGAEHLRPTVRLPPRPDYVLISTQELDLMADMQRRPETDIFWGALGLFLGSLPPAIASFAQLGKGAFGFLDLLPILILTASAFVGGLMAYFGFRKKARIDAILDDIRSRQRIEARTIVELDYP